MVSLPIERRTDDDAVGVADVVLSDLELKVAAEEVTRLAAEARSKGESGIGLDVCVPGLPPTIATGPTPSNS